MKHKSLKRKICKLLKKLNLPHNKSYVKSFFKAAQANTYVETVNGNHADVLHYHLHKRESEDLQETFHSLVLPVAKKQRFSSVKVAIDITDENFYGEQQGIYMIPCKVKNGVKAKFKFLVASVVNPRRKEKIPFFVMPIHLGHDKQNLISEVCQVSKKLFKQIDLFLLDRGFYSISLIDKLNKERIPYIIFIPKSLEKRSILASMYQDCAVAEWEKTYNKHFTMHKVKFNMVFIKDVRGYDWIFATNINKKYAEDYVRMYKWRWQIETNFRVQDEARIKSKSKNYVIRLFYFIISLLLQVIWEVTEKGVHPFKAFLMNLYEECLREEIIAELS